MSILAIDPSLTCFGMALIDTPTMVVGDMRLAQAACIRTKKESGKRKIFVADDDARRADELARGLLAKIEEWQPAAVIVEQLPGGTQHARSAMTLGITAGVIAAVRASMLKFSNEVMVWEYLQPSDVRKELCGKPSASKQDAHAAAIAATGGALGGYAGDVTAPEIEAIRDCEVLAVAALQMRMMCAIISVHENQRSSTDFGMNPVAARP